MSRFTPPRKRASALSRSKVQTYTGKPRKPPVIPEAEAIGDPAAGARAPRSERCSRLAPGGITGAKVPRYRLALLQGAIRRSSNFSTEVSETPRTISTITGTNVLSISNTLAYRVIMKPRPVMVV